MFETTLEYNSDTTLQMWKRRGCDVHGCQPVGRQVGPLVLGLRVGRRVGFRVGPLTVGLLVGFRVGLRVGSRNTKGN